MTNFRSEFPIMVQLQPLKDFAKISKYTNIQIFPHLILSTKYEKPEDFSTVTPTTLKYRCLKFRATLRHPCFKKIHQS